MTVADPALRAQALRLLGPREHSRAELADKLQRRGHDPAAVAGLLDEMEHAGLVDDTRFARLFAAARAGRGQGPVRIRRDLAARGVAPKAVEAGLAALEEDWGTVMARARDARFGPAPPRDRQEWVRQARFLEYRGFPTAGIRRFLDGGEP